MRGSQPSSLDLPPLQKSPRNPHSRRPEEFLIRGRIVQKESQKVASCRTLEPKPLVRERQFPVAAVPLCDCRLFASTSKDVGDPLCRRFELLSVHKYLSLLKGIGETLSTDDEKCKALPTPPI